MRLAWACGGQKGGSDNDQLSNSCAVSPPHPVSISGQDEGRLCSWYKQMVERLAQPIRYVITFSRWELDKKKHRSTVFQIRLDNTEKFWKVIWHLFTTTAKKKKRSVLKNAIVFLWNCIFRKWMLTKKNLGIWQANLTSIISTVLVLQEYIVTARIYWELNLSWVLSPCCKNFLYSDTFIPHNSMRKMRRTPSGMQFTQGPQCQSQYLKSGPSVHPLKI